MKVTILTPHIFRSPFSEHCKSININRFPYFYPYSLQRIADGKGIGDNIKTNSLAFIQIPFLVTSGLFFAIKLFSQNHFDYFHSHWVIPQGLIGAILSIMFKKKHISTIHAADVFLMKRILLKKYLFKFIIHNTTHFFVVSSYVHKTILEMLLEEDKITFLSKSSILPMGINNDKFYLKTSKSILKQKYVKNDAIILLFIGRLTAKKGVEFLIQSMDTIVDYCDNIHLIICGEGPNKDDLTQKVFNLKLQKNISFFGYIEETEKIELLSIADIVIVPSIILENGETEGMPVVILEGLAAGKAIIASNVSGISDVIQDGINGILIQERAPNQISDAVIKLLKQPKFKKELEDHAKESSKYYSWDIISEEYFKQFE